MKTKRFVPVRARLVILRTTTLYTVYWRYFVLCWKYLRLSRKIAKLKLKFLGS